MADNATTGEWRMSLEELKPEFLFTLCLAAGGAVWKLILMIFGWRDRLKAVEAVTVQHGKDFTDFKATVEAQYNAVRGDIRDSITASEERHADLVKRIDAFMDRRGSTR